MNANESNDYLHVEMDTADTKACYYHDQQEC